MNTAPRISVSYSHADEAWKERVVRQLRVLEPEGRFAVWDDRRIAAGADWPAEINRAIAGCDVALLLVSADFLTSRFILGEEVPAFLARCSEQGIHVLPLIVAPCTWQRVPWLASLAARPKDGKPLTSMSRPAAEAALAALAGEIADLLLTPISKASSLPNAGVPGARPSAAAVRVWREKLEFLRVQEAICSDPAQRFTLKKQIEEAEAKFRELS